jgi:L,D-transpeptidase catalytic domain
MCDFDQAAGGAKGRRVNSVMAPSTATARRGPRVLLGCLLAFACLALLPAVAGAEGTSGKAVPLSNERTLTTWAQSESVGGIYAHPVIGAAPLAMVHMFNADGFPEVYMVLSSYVNSEGREWARVRIPGRPNGRVGWMLRERLGSFHRTRWRIVVNLEWHRMWVYFGGRLMRVFPVGVGKPSTPTPTGHFWVDERFKLSDPSSPYWPYALGTSDYSTLPHWAGEGVVGIHGPFGEPQRIPGDPSHGCIRMLVGDMAWLGPRVTLGTPVQVVR